jgi:D-3-phosphoglycerate dehydrogenase
MRKCLIVDKMHETIILDLKNIGFESDYRPNIEREEIIEIIGNYDGLIIRSKTSVDPELLRNKGSLTFIARAGAGVDLIDVEGIQNLGVQIINAPEGNRDALGEHAMGILLTLLNKINTSDDEVRHWKWLRDKNRGYELQGKTVGILGYGNMGSAFARKLSGFDCHVIAYDKYRDTPYDDYAKAVSEEELFEQTQVLSLHIPLNQENEFYINKSYLDKFRNDLFIVNTARGKVLNLEDLVTLMKNGKVLGAALDVLQNEKLESLSGEEKDSFEYLIHSERTVLTPHIAGWSYESYRKINTVLCEKISRLYTQQVQD